MDFLTSIWGEAEGFRCVVSGKMKHAFYKDSATLKPCNSATDYWFAPSIFKTAERKSDNVVSTKAFWLDIDCKEGKYDTIIDAVTALATFANGLDLPTPVVVRSGNGVHCYWILDRAVPSERWHRIANALRLACVDLGLEADHSVTKDIARILRVPGTSNYKDPKNPKPVVLETGITTCTYQELEEALSDYVYQYELALEAKRTNSEFAIDYPQVPKDADAIADRCSQLQQLRELRGNLPEPVWYAGLGVVALCNDAEGVACRWSDGHPDYSEKATLSKLERAREFAPTTCSKFAEVNPDGCKGCPFQGKITSPIQLGETVTPLDLEPANLPAEIQANPQKTQALEPAKLPPPLVPKPYACGKEGVFKMIIGTEDEPPQKERILEYPLWVSRLMVGEDGTGTEIELSWINAEGKRRSAAVRTAMLASAQTLEGALRDININFFWQIKSVLRYLNDCVMHVARTQKEEIVYGKFGFTDDLSGFVIGTNIIRRDGRENANISARIDRKRITYVAERGSIENWRNATRLLDEPRFWMHRFTVLACLGCPLLSLSGNEGSILSLAGESGSGKTTTAYLGIAAYGDPKAFTIDPQSTLKAFYEHWRQAGNLPVVINEASTIKREYLNLLTLAAANGKARDTMTQDSRLNHSGEWQTLTIFTSNFHMLEMSLSVIQEAGQRRILELSFGKENCLPLSIGRPVNALLEKNHGIAGRLFLDFVMANADDVRKLVLDRVVELEQGIDSVHRYNVWLIAVASVAGDIASGLGLIDFQCKDAIDNAVRILKKQAVELKTPDERVDELLADYTTEFQRDIGIKEMTNATAWHKEPFGSPRGRYNSDKAKGGTYELCIPVRLFKEYALGRGIDISQIKQYMAARSARESNVRLSSESGGVWCYVMPYQKTDES